MTAFVAVTDSPVGDDLSIEREVLTGMDVEKVGSGDELTEALQNADGILCMHSHIDRQLIGSLHGCKIIARYGSGLDNIDLAAAEEAGIPVVGVQAYCTQEVADHTIALLLNWNRKILEYHRFVTEKRWNQRPLTTGNWGCGPLSRLSDQTLGLIGFGRIAQAVAYRAAAFGMSVLATSRQPDRATAQRLGVELTERTELLRRADFVSLHVPLSDTTRHLIDKQALQIMKQGAVLINTARGALVNEAALAVALRDGQIAGALLDVYEQSPLPLDHPLRELPNVLFTPHVAFFSEGSLAQLRRSAASAVLRYLA